MPPTLSPFTARAIIPYSPDAIYKALTDYDSWQEWVPSLASTTVLTREDVLAVIELGIAGQAVPALMMECIATPGQRVLARVIEGKSTVREMEWSIQAAAEGSTKVSVTIKRTIGLHLFKPAAWLQISPAKCLEALEAWMSAANPGPETVVGGDNMFELWETEKGLVCWIRGRKYNLTPAKDS